MVSAEDTDRRLLKLLREINNHVLELVDERVGALEKRVLELEKLVDSDGKSQNRG